ncbi:hypothetical protein GCM10022260_08800 [Gaetbulibacter aestuarii]
MDENTRIFGNSDLEFEGNFLAQLLRQQTGVSIPFDTQKNGNILLKLDSSIQNKEAYILSIQPEIIIISGKTSAGIFYGIQSLCQLISNQNETITIPATLIKDKPRFAYRGMHLDVARHFFPPEFIKRYIDFLALHKMNRFHWHLTDDQGWRIEIKKYPKLTDIGGWRNGTIKGHFPGTTNDNQRYGGFYSQKEIKDIIGYAASRHITIIPEIELPGHSSAAIAAYPFLSCFPKEPTIIPNNMISKVSKIQQNEGQPKIVQETWGVFNDVYCAGKEETFTFVENVLLEVMDLFPSKYIHIGGDECPKGNWKRCPQCQKRMKELGLADEHELQSYFIQRVEKFVNSKGKQIIGWDEILEGGLAPNATVMSWRGNRGGIAAAKENHDVIMSPNSHCYFDHYQSKNKDTEPLAIGGYLPIEKVYAFNPVPDELDGHKHQFILGGQANLWTEYITSQSQAEYMLFPRMTALSEVLWTSPDQKNWGDFKWRLKQFKSLYEAWNINYCKHVFAD